MSIVEISVSAGEILLALDRNGGTVRLEQLTQHRSCARDTALMALGWLFKEGLVIVQPAVGDWVVKARPSG